MYEQTYAVRVCSGTKRISLPVQATVNSVSYKTGEIMAENNYTLHETMEIHELLNLKTISMAKFKLLQGLVFDEELKVLMQKDVSQSMQAVKALRGLLASTQHLS
jgi:similar to spore coat protein